MNQEQTIALWNKCQAAKKVLLDAGKNEVDAHQAAEDVWNAWAQGMLNEKARLKKAGEWKVKVSVFSNIANNDKTKDWFERAKVDFSNISFLVHSDKTNTFCFRDEKREIKKYVLCKGEKINFSHFIFPNSANYDSAKFLNEVFFISSVFWGRADFHKVKFFNKSWFLCVHLYENARFMQVDFLGYARFGGAIFSKDAYFSEVTFYDHTDFSSIIVNGLTDFKNSLFMKVAHFSNTSFYGGAIFENVIFSDLAWFHSVTFNQIGHFHSSKFEAGAVFDEAIFNDFANFTSILSKHHFSLNNAIFIFVPDFIQANFHQAPRLDNIHIQKVGGWWKNSKVNSNISAMYRALKRIAEDGKDYNNEMIFFAGEMRTTRFNTDFPYPLFPLRREKKYSEQEIKRRNKWDEEEKRRTVRRKKTTLEWQERKEKDKNFSDELIIPATEHPLSPFVERRLSWWPNGARFWFGWFYELFSDFGRSLLRPLAAILFIKLLLGTYIFSYETGTRNCLKTTPSNAAIYLTTQYGLPFVSANSKQKNMLAKACLFGWVKKNKIAVMPDPIIFWGVLHNLLALIFLFLFGLALRNHFRMK